MLLMANPSCRDQAASFQLRQFALGRSGARARVSNQLRGIEATLGLTEKHPENALLCLREQRIGQALATGSVLCTQYGHNYALFGHERQGRSCFNFGEPRSRSAQAVS